MVIDDELRASRLAVTAIGVAGAAVTLTLPAAGVGLTHYITFIRITKFAAALLTAGATPVVVTSTNLPGGVAWSFSAGAELAGSSVDLNASPTGPLVASAANTATTIVCPATPSIIWRVTVYYFAVV